jgi:hypothetical protein
MTESVKLRMTNNVERIQAAAQQWSLVPRMRVQAHRSGSHKGKPPKSYRSKPKKDPSTIQSLPQPTPQATSRTPPPPAPTSNPSQSQLALNSRAGMTPRIGRVLFQSGKARL